MTECIRRASLAVAGALLLAPTGAVGGTEATDPRLGLRWAEPVAVATGNAYRGPWRMNESVFDFVDDPTVAFLSGGDTAVAWVDHTRKDVLLQRYDPDGEPRLSRPVNVSRTPEVFSWLPRLAVAPGQPDTVYALWQEIVFSGGTHGGEIFFARSSDGGASFSEAFNLSRTEAGAGKGRLSPDYWHNGSLDIAVGPEGTVYAAWTEYQGSLRLARSTDGGASFSDPRRLAGGPGALPARGPSLAVGADGAVHLAWTVGADPAADIHYARSTDGGRSFGDVRAVASSAGHADAPKLAVDDQGTVHLAYGLSPEGPLRRYDVVYTRRAVASGGFEPPRAISRPLPARFVGAGFPDLAVTGGDRVYVTCELFTGAAHRQPLALALMRSADAGDSFTNPSLVPGTADAGAGFNGSQQGLLMRKLDAGPGGAIAVVNSKFDRGDASRVRLVRATPARGGSQ